MKLTEQAHQELSKVLKPGDYAIDATLGNGHDTQFLARQVGEGGKVFAFDIQIDSIEESTRMLAKDDLLSRVSFNHENHDQIKKLIPPDWVGKIKAATFNLGYLPGGNKKVITESKSTIPALEQVYHILSPQGIITLIAYRGHEGGRIEHEEIKKFIRDQNWLAEEKTNNLNQESPVMFIIRKN